MAELLETECVQTYEERIERLIWSKTSGGIRDLHVQVLDSEVVLSGHTETYYNKQLATHAVLEELGELRLRNYIEVC